MMDVAFQYAEALYFLANESKKTDMVKKAYQDFLSLYQSTLSPYLLHPKLTKTDKKALIEPLKTEKLFQDFLFVLVDKNRFELVEKVFEAYVTLIDHQMDLLRVKVSSSKPLSEKQLMNIKQALNHKLKRTIEIENIVDPKIVGGIKITYEGQVLDNTINHFIKSLSDAIKA